MRLIQCNEFRSEVPTASKKPTGQMASISRAIVPRARGFIAELKETFNAIFNQREERGKLNWGYAIIGIYTSVYMGAKVRQNGGDHIPHGKPMPIQWRGNRKARKLEEAKRAAKPDIVVDAL